MRPFRLDIPDADLVDLHRRLDSTRWPGEVPDVPWRRGVPLSYLKELVDYWRSEYDWRTHEARLNQIPQFTTTIDGVEIHFVHVRSPEPDALPLIVTHGWPGSIVEFLDIIEPLTDPRRYGGDPTDAFHLVLPSIPGFGLSGPIREPGWDVPRIARAWAELMRRLGYHRYGAQGGDWGHAITRELAVLDAGHVTGIHLNTLLTLPSGDPAEAAALTDADRARLDRLTRAEPEMSGYARIQSTRPQTLAYALTDSPVGQLAWIIEKFKEWTDSTDAPEDAIPRDLLLTNVMLYWLMAAGGSSANVYYEAAHPTGTPHPPSSTVPTGVAVFAGDVAAPVRRLAERDNNIVHWSEFDRGGHFAAMEEPDLFIADLRRFFALLRRPVAGYDPAG
ncbi:epoxide hydrolase family protein [Micromonospora sonneratiae]|uniref:Epoxide hydrolase family protein n=1 Tax=Micromonospora sonneratiae TaxID=1184706 RepID=A0ABW3YDM0_9ACTN